MKNQISCSAMSLSSSQLAEQKLGHQRPISAAKHIKYDFYFCSAFSAQALEEQLLAAQDSVSLDAEMV